MSANTKIDDLKKDIEKITSQINKTRLSPSELQNMNDLIAEKKREIEKLSRTEKIISPIIGAPTIGEKTNDPEFDTITENRFII